MTDGGVDRSDRSGRVRRIVLLLLGIALVTLGWRAMGWGTSTGRRLTVHTVDASGVRAPGRRAGRGGDTIRVLVWNIAHGRGDVRTGWLKNWSGGSEERRDRLSRMAEVLRESSADVVLLNEVDFDAGWSGGVNQVEIIAREGGFAWWVEQRNVDLHLPFTRYAFGNAVLSRLPVVKTAWLDLPAHSWIESIVWGSKEAAVVHLEAGDRTVSVVAVHLDFRAEETRLKALPVLDSLRLAQEPPLILGGDFNVSPPGWAGATARTVVGELLESGWTSGRAGEAEDSVRPTFPTRSPDRALDWVLVEPPLRVLEARVVVGASKLSDHAPVLATVVWSES